MSRGSPGRLPQGAECDWGSLRGIMRDDAPFTFSTFVWGRVHFPHSDGGMFSVSVRRGNSQATLAADYVSPPHGCWSVHRPDGGGDLPGDVFTFLQRVS